MKDTKEIFHAGRTMRWHKNPHLSDTTDPLDGHQGRTARICLALWPDCSRDLLVAALTHDDGESVTGDKPFDRPKTTEEAAQEEIARRGIWGDVLPTLTQTDKRRLKYADRLDAYTWAEHHRPHLMDAPEWLEARQWLYREWLEIQSAERNAA